MTTPPTPPPPDEDTRGIYGWTREYMRRNRIPVETPSTTPSAITQQILAECTKEGADLRRITRLFPQYLLNIAHLEMLFEHRMGMTFQEYHERRYPHHPSQN